MSTNYTEQTWADGDATKPLSAARLTHIEDGIAAVDTAAAAAAAQATTAQAAAIAAAAADATTKVGTETTRATTAEALLAPKASPALTGNPTAPTQAAGDNSTKLATTAYADTGDATRLLKGNVVTKTASYTAVVGDVILADTTSATFTVTIPAASGGKGRIVIKWVKGTVAPTINLTGTDHVNTSTGVQTFTPVLLNQGYQLESDGAALWAVTADDLPLSLLDTRYAAAGGSGLPSTIVSKTTAYTAAAGDFVEADTSTAGFTVTLPTAPAAGVLVAVKKVSGDTNTLTIAPAGGGTIDGSATATTITPMAGLILEHKASNVWRVAASMSVTGPAGTNGTNGINGALAIVKDEGTTLTQRDTIDFVGTGVTVTDTGTKYQVSVPGASGVSPFAVRSGNYFTAPQAPNSGNWGPGVGFVRWFPIIVPSAITVAAIGGYATAGATGAVWRFGVYADDGNMRPAGLLLDTGATAAITTSGWVEVGSLSLALATGIYWIGAVQQVAAATMSSMAHTIPIPVPTTPLSSANGIPLGFSGSGGVTGAMPNPAPTFVAADVVTTASSAVPRVYLKVA